MKRVEDDASNFRINVGFKTFKWLLLELHPDFDMGLLESRLFDKVIYKAMDKVEKEKVTARVATGPSGSNPTESPELTAKKSSSL